MRRTRLVTIVVTVCMVSLVPARGAQAPPDVELLSARNPIQFHPVTSKPAKGVFEPRAFHCFPKLITTSDGRALVGLGVHAWFDGSRVRFTTRLVGPKDPARLCERDNVNWEGTLIPLVDFDLGVGQSRRLDELKKLGIPPVTIRVQPPGYIKH